MLAKDYPKKRSSPEKRFRRDAKKRAANKSSIHALRTAVKKVNQGINSNDTSSRHAQKTLTPLEAQECARKAQKMLAMAASKGVIHPNAAARRTSRMMKKVASFSEKKS